MASPAKVLPAKTERRNSLMGRRGRKDDEKNASQIETTFTKLLNEEEERQKMAEEERKDKTKSSKKKASVDKTEVDDEVEHAEFEARLIALGVRDMEAQGREKKDILQEKQRYIKTVGELRDARRRALAKDGGVIGAPSASAASAPSAAAMADRKSRAGGPGTNRRSRAESMEWGGGNAAAALEAQLNMLDGTRERRQSSQQGGGGSKMAKRKQSISSSLSAAAGALSGRSRKTSALDGKESNGSESFKNGITPGSSSSASSSSPIPELGDASDKPRTGRRSSFLEMLRLGGSNGFNKEEGGGGGGDGSVSAKEAKAEIERLKQLRAGSNARAASSAASSAVKGLGRRGSSFLHRINGTVSTRRDESDDEEDRSPSPKPPRPGLGRRISNAGVGFFRSDGYKRGGGWSRQMIADSPAAAPEPSYLRAK